MKKLMCLLVMLACVSSASAALLYSIPALPDSTIGTNLTNVWPRDVSGWNGGTVKAVALDRSWGGALPEPMVWSVAGGSVEMLGLSGSTAVKEVRGISGNGSMIVGYDKGLGWHAVQFYADGTSNARRLTTTYGDTEAYGVSDDGSKAFGYGVTGTPASPYSSAATFATASDSMVSTPVGGNWTNAAGDDATALAGNFRLQTQAFAVRAGVKYNLTGNTNTKAWGITDDASTVVGVYDIANDDGRYWTWEGAGYTSRNIPNVIGHSCVKWEITGITGDGKYIVGQAKSTTAWAPFIWDTAEAAPVRLIDFLLPSQLAAIPSGYSLYSITAISGDGTAITGTMGDGTDTLGYVAYISEPATMVLLGLGGLALIRKRR